MPRTRWECVHRRVKKEVDSAVSERPIWGLRNSAESYGGMESTVGGGPLKA